ncbi:K02A2.6-like, partial [Cordylochernes scorpioides]
MASSLRGVFGLQEDSARRAEEVLKSRAQKAEESSESYIKEILGLCHQVDPRMEEALNKFVQREHYPIRPVEYTLAQMGGAKLFSRLDANSGFWQIPLSEESSSLTTFLTPFGRYRFKRLPFGISSAPDVFQRKMSNLLESQSGVNCHMDDIVIWGATQEEHDERLKCVLRKLQDSGLTLNREKCIFSVKEIKFLGHLITERGVLPDPNKVQAIREFPPPSSISEVRKFPGNDEMTPRIQRLRLRMLRYSYSIHHTPGKDIVVADALSRSPINISHEKDLENEICSFVQQITSCPPFKDENMKEIWQYQNEERECREIKDYCKKGWPTKNELSAEAKAFWFLRYEMSVIDGLIVRNSRIYIPKSLRSKVLNSLHEGHLGIEKCRGRARSSVWWPRISQEIGELVRNCPNCIEKRSNPQQPLIVSDFPSRPWEKVGIDHFYLKGKYNLLIADYYSRYPELALLEDQTIHSTIIHCKSIFACQSNTRRGSSINLMRRDLLAKYKWKSSPSETTITTIDESHVRATENIEVELQVDDQQRMMTATILREMPFELLIGKPTMRDLRIQWNFGTDEIKCLSLRSKEVIFTSDDLITIFPKLCNVSKKELPLHEIDFLLKPNNNIVACKPYPMSFHKRAWTAGKIKEMLDGDIITPSTSEYASPCILVPKTDSSYRLCIDHRQLNKETFLDPFPRIDSIINRFGGCRYFTKIYLKDGFCQVGLTKATRKFSAFVTPDGLYEFKRLPFGWKNSPPRFQRVMSEMLADLLELGVVVYIDDICCGAPTLEECASLTYKVLNRLNQYNMTVNLGKCQICISEVELLGRIINGHFRAYIPNYATIVRPLGNLKKKYSSFMWSHKCEEAYLKPIDTITSKPILAIPDESLPYEMSTDASYYGIGAILYQRDVNERKSLQLRVIIYYSCAFSKAEQNYSITDKECLAVLKAVKHFRWLMKQMTARFIWTIIKKNVQEWARTCMGCQINNISRHTKSEMGTFPKTADRFSVVHIDCIGPLPLSNDHLYSLTCIDRFTGWPEAIPLKYIKVETLAKAFYDNWIARFGMLTTVITECAKLFDSTFFKELVTICGNKE